MFVANTSPSRSQSTSPVRTQSPLRTQSPVRPRQTHSSATSETSSSQNNTAPITEAEEKKKALNFAIAKARFNGSRGQKNLQNFLTNAKKNPPNNT